MRTPRAVLLVLLVLAAVPFGLNLGNLGQRRIPWFMDTVAYFYPLRLHAARLIESGEMPLWNRTLYAGAPFLANPQLGLAYPGNWPMLAWPGPRSFLLVNAAHVALLGIGAFLWVRLLSGCAWGALFAGLAVELGGWTRAHEAFGSYLQAGAWAPWMLWAFEAAARRNRSEAGCRGAVFADSRSACARWGVAAGVFGAMQWLAGAPQLAFYSHAGVVLYVLAAWALSVRGLQSAVGDARVSLRSAALFLGVFAPVSLGLSAPQWTTSRAFLLECERAQGLALEQVVQGTLTLRETARAWVGGTGRPEDAETILYPGYAALALALAGAAAVASRRRGRSASPRALVLVVLVLLASAICWKALAPFLHRYAPFYDRFHDPKRVLFLAYLGTIALSGLGLAFVLGLIPGESPSARRTRRVLLPVLLVLVSFLDLTQFARRRIDVKTARPSRFAVSDVAAATGIAPGERFFAHDMGIQYSYNYTRPDFAHSLLPNLGALYGLEDVQGYEPFVPWRYGLFMRLLNRAPVRAVTLYPKHFGLVRNADSPWLSRFGPLKARGPIDFDWPFFVPRWLAPGESAHLTLPRPFLASAENAARMRVYLARVVPFVLPLPACRLNLHFHEGEREVLGPVVVERSDLAGADSLYADVLAPTDPISPVSRGRIVLPEAPSASRGNEGASAASLGQNVPGANARSWADRVSIRNPGRLPVLFYSIGLPRDPGPFRATAVPGTFASTWDDSFPDDVRIWETPPGATGARAWHEYEFAPALSPSQVNVEIPRNEKWPDVPRRVIKGWKWVEKKSNRLRVALPAGHAGGWVVLSEAFAPGWRCRVDGREETIRAADVMFRAVAVAAGAREIEMRYVPPGLWEGLWVFGVVLLGVLVVGVGAAYVTLRDGRWREVLAPHRA